MVVGEASAVWAAAVLLFAAFASFVRLHDYRGRKYLYSPCTKPEHGADIYHEAGLNF